MSATIIAFPGVDLAALAEPKDPRGQTLVIRRQRDAFFLAIEPAGGAVHQRFASAGDARLHAWRLRETFPRLYNCIIDETHLTRQPPVGIVAGAISADGNAA